MLRHAQVTGMNNPVEEAACAEAGIHTCPFKMRTGVTVAGENGKKLVEH